MNILEYVTERTRAAGTLTEGGDYLAAAKILEALAKEVKAHGMAMQHGVGKPFTAPRAS